MSELLENLKTLEANRRNVLHRDYVAIVRRAVAGRSRGDDAERFLQIATALGKNQRELEIDVRNLAGYEQAVENVLTFDPTKIADDLHAKGDGLERAYAALRLAENAVGAALREQAVALGRRDAMTAALAFRDRAREQVARLFADPTERE